MTHDTGTSAFAAPARASTRRPATALTLRLQALRGALVERMTGPGGAYNIGNLVGFSQGVAVQVLATRDGDEFAWANATAAIGHSLTGDFASIAMTSAAGVFFVSGEVYHRAWSGRPVPRRNMVRLGDFLSGIGAIWLGLALLELGHPFLALTSGLLHSLGKFGSAFQAADARVLALGAYSSDPFRLMVLLSRLPALAAAAYGICALLFQLDGVGQQHWSTAPTLFCCYLLWSWADLLLLRSSRHDAGNDRATA